MRVWSSHAGYNFIRKCCRQQHIAQGSAIFCTLVLLRVAALEAIKYLTNGAPRSNCILDKWEKNDDLPRPLFPARFCIFFLH
mmetsp:Transcript_28976/g.69979  ORF Transcript_28976/g.69979 Transcript_28976/m.69979 type:complete len:82 (-) Transcript_28976:255-500(-)